MTKRIETAKDAIVGALKFGGDGARMTQTEIYKTLEGKGFPNNNTIRGRLSELVRNGTLNRRTRWHGDNGVVYTLNS